MLDAAYIPSLWAVQKTVLMVLLGIVIGPLSVASVATQTLWFTAASPMRPDDENLTFDIPSKTYLAHMGHCPLGWAMSWRVASFYFG